MNTFPQILKELRKERSLTQNELAGKLQYTQSCISEWEKGTIEPKATALETMAKFFNVSVDYLLGRTDELGGIIITDEERAAGWSDAARITVTPLEDDMLQLFRKIGEKYGKETQKTAIAMLENALGLK